MLLERHRNVLKTLRKKIRLKYFLRKQQTKSIRNQLRYKIRDFFGMAPHLRTDTKEESSLKSIPWFLRHRARKFIWPNQSDWGFYRVTPNDPRKGVPKRGFEVGTITELADQALYGGFRLPGGVIMSPKDSTHRTVTDMSILNEKIIPLGSLVRIRDQIFQVISIGENSIELDRKWRGTAKDTALPIALYRLPSEPGESQRRFYTALYRLSKFALTSPTAALYYSIHTQSALCAAGRCVWIARLCHGVGLEQGARDWVVCAERCIESSVWAERFTAHL